MRVVAPIDSSRFSQAVIDALIGTHWATGTEIHLLTVMSSHEPVTHSSGDSWDFGSSTDDAEMAMAAIAQDMQRSLPECRISYSVREGDPKGQILALAEEWQSNLIVMGSRGSRGIERILLGSVSQAVLSQSGCPVLVAKSDGAVLDLQRGFANVLLAVDNSAHARAALHWLTNFSWRPMTQFRLVTVIESLSPRFAMETNTARAAGLAQEHENVFMAARDNVSDLGVELTQLLHTDKVSIEVAEGDPCECIVKAAEKMSADLIVIGSHGRTGFSKLLLGSVSQAVSLQAPCSVAVVRGLLPTSATNIQKTGVFKVPKLSKLRAEYSRFARENEEQTTHIMPPGIG